MTETVTFRPRRPKRELRRVFKNLNARLNDLVEREMAAQPTDWRDILDTPGPVISKKDYARCLKPE